VGTRAWPALSLLVAAALVWRLWRGPNPPFLWALVALVLAYWLLIAAAGRQPDSSRYLFAGAVALLLLGAEALRGYQVSYPVVASFFVVVAVGLPHNFQLLSDGRELKLDETTLNRVEAGAEQLVGANLNPMYSPANDPITAARGGVGATTITAGDYLRGAARVGPFGYPAARIDALPSRWRNLADVVLAHSGGLEVRQSAPSASHSCRRLAPTVSGRGLTFSIPPEGVRVGPAAPRSSQLGARLFGPAPFPIGSASPRRWLTLETSLRPAVPRPWQVLADSPVTVCPAGSA
jgi:hypothetical protein